MLLTAPSTGQTAELIGSELPVPAPEQELPEPPELEPSEVPGAPEAPETPDAVEPLEAPDVELPEEPCFCGIRCCTSPFELTRSPNLLNFHLPEVASISCCGCTSCPADYFILPVSRAFVFQMLSSLSSLRMPGLAVSGDD
ncbi:uncharacterized protein LOC117345351 [Pecten maximus]|uniref:uncharacterized protein LOC117345351 n=1 Tax=Pecten maximus TaxID=6579 RepID=UPI001458398B|nr:uncharacterized protein LOC117345351 [Pecten maximus]